MANESPRSTFFGPLLLARDFEQTLAFYRTQLGLRFEGSFPYAKCVSTASTLSIVDGTWWAKVNGSENPNQGESSVSDLVLMLRVGDVEEVFARLTATGVKFLSPPEAREQLGVRSLFLRDPDGRTVTLTSPLG
jgi:predicted enzyme related to lactoylglutathione lyase